MLSPKKAVVMADVRQKMVVVVRKYYILFNKADIALIAECF